ncbi:hypothetical protein SUGI_0320450 [Cryptomeria japonica]|uniref:LOB domain-containing protein 1-like n=1 Tax=Cryptomeria japonica TaxID=3369 RepID=UPI002408CBEA|nr:LOB domain-containing protein 1-like [Cryptomeria japonica]GLJ18138.1 hypothetical protein SUGI_0320450 [Cryptomeria japonica]
MSQIVYPCAACKIQRRKCGEKCILAPYFPPNDPQKYLVVHKLFGTKSILRILQGIPVEKRADAVISMVYEANARRDDPIYGCAGAVCRLQRQIFQLHLQLATIKAELLNSQANLVSLETGFCNGGDAESSVIHNKDDLLFLQDGEKPIRKWY